MEGYDRVRAVEKLAAAGYRDAVVPLIEALDDPIPEVREHIIDALTVLGDLRAAGPLIALLLREREPLIRDKLVGALEAINHQDSLKQLEAALDQEDPAARQTAAWALRRLAWERLADLPRAKIAIIQSDWTSAAALGSVAVNPLIDVVRLGTDISRRAAAEALCQIGSAEALQAIRSILHDRDAPRPARDVAAWALRRVLWKGVTDEDLSRAMVLLGEWHDLSKLGVVAVEALTEALADQRERVRQRAVEALRAIGGDEAMKTLAFLFADETREPSVRDVAARAIGEMGGDGAVAAILPGLSANNWQIRVAAVESLRQLGWEPSGPQETILACMAEKKWSQLGAYGAVAVEPLIEAMRLPSVSWDAARALASVEPAGVDTLLAMLEDPDCALESREAISTVLADAGVSRAIAPIKAWLKDTDPDIRQAAVRSLERLGWEPDSIADRATVAVAHDDWDSLRGLGSGATASLLQLARSSIAPQETLESLVYLLEKSSKQVSIPQLRMMVKLPTPTAAPDTAFSEACDPELLAENTALVHKMAKTELLRRGIMF